MVIHEWRHSLFDIFLLDETLFYQLLSHNIYRKYLRISSEFELKFVDTVKPELTTTSEQRPPSTCLQRSLFWGLNFNIYSIQVPLNNDHPSTTATIFGARGWSLYSDLTVFSQFALYAGQKKVTQNKKILWFLEVLGILVFFVPVKIYNWWYFWTKFNL